MATINAGRVNCTKNAHGAHHGSHDYSCHQEVATKKQADLQSKYARNLAQIIISKQQKDIWDVSDPSFVIPTHIQSQWLIIEQKGNWRECTYCEELGRSLPSNYAAHCSKILLIMHPFKTSQVGAGKVSYWSPVMVYLSQELTSSSRTCPSMNKVVLHTKIALDEMLTISNIVVATLQGFLLPQMALLRSQTRTSVLPRSRSLPSMTGQNICPP